LPEHAIVEPTCAGSWVFLYQRILNHDDAHTNKTEEDGNVKNKPLMNHIVEDGKFKDDFFGNLTICNVPDSLLREFMRTVVWPKYPGGISEALQDLMRKEVQKQKKLGAF
jgi:hypothetical protein